MAKWALVVDGRVREITEINPEGRFHPDFNWVSCGAKVREGWAYDGSEFTAPVEEVAPVTLPAATLYQKLTDDEFDALDESVETVEGRRLHRAFTAVVMFNEGDEMWALLVKHLDLLGFTKARKAEVLSPF